MRTKYQHYFKKSEKELKIIWEKASIVFDANCLLNLYRYSDSAKDEFLSILVKLEKRIWLPEQAASEFFQNRLSEISKQSKTYDENIKLIETLKDNLSNNRGHPFLPKKQLEDFLKSLDLAKTNFDTAKSGHLQKLNEDDVLSSLSKLFSDRVGEELSEDKLAEVMENGPDRMKAQIPPGFKDYPKHNDPKSEYEKKSNFGDLILWLQLIENAKKNQKPVVLVTDDWKEDWWEQVHGRTIGPRPELIKEFFLETTQDILIYRSEQFLKYAKVHLNAEISEDTLSEVKDAQRRRLSAYSKVKRDIDFKKYERNRLAMQEINQAYSSGKRHIAEGIDDSILILRERLEHLEREISFFEQHLKSLRERAYQLYDQLSQRSVSEESLSEEDKSHYSALMEALSEEAKELEEKISKLKVQRDRYLNTLSPIQTGPDS